MIRARSAGTFLVKAPYGYKGLNGDGTPADFAQRWLADEGQITSNQPTNSGSTPC